ncbi:EEF1A lysine methyltransferase 1 isoform X1 [Pteropus medius]|uniref:EEF1A lysine methyltransferase 1 isoform X1 n=2 Tax=Pteropus vampyrus TaxID=132908 RepID=UPI00196ADA60|nr:EEF1A lysine methyltransferase 1 isoform X1 [Pteropus giganteus]XP_039719076.1 EEF1A lysine methyltransferase 1 isoform X1 [Pteropus giganteus]XP_039719082.1 EEF1A lysine methyltransferase 1 isoform X1 [Pteropus giganteus]
MAVNAWTACEMSDSEDDGVPRLSSHTLAALQEFYAEQEQHAGLGGGDKDSIGVIEENWQLSQFWYSQETALRLAQEAIAAAGEGGRVACVSAPSVYRELRELCGGRVSACVFEYDRRFAVYGPDFVFYDYARPLDLPRHVAAHSFDIVVADPPYLSEECLQKTSETIKYLTRGKILLCTGAVMAEAAARLLGVKACRFLPRHARALANEFRCYVNYKSGLDRED